MRAAVLDLQRAFVASDWRGVCGRLTNSAKNQAGLVAHGAPGLCVEDLREALKALEPGGGIRHAGEPRLGDVHVDGERATATVALGGWATDVPLAREGGAWRVDSFFGSSVDAARSTMQGARSRPFPATGGAPVEGLTPARAPCVDFFEDSYPNVSGNCSITATGGKVEITILTALGDFKFADCTLEYRAFVDGEGRTWTTGFVVDSAGPNNGCADVKECEQYGIVQPWKGRIRDNGDGTFVHDMRVCLNTCIGYYTGSLELQLSPRGGAWRVRAPDSGVGGSGLRLDGRLKIGVPGFELRAARA